MFNTLISIILSLSVLSTAYSREILLTTQNTINLSAPIDDQSISEVIEKHVKLSAKYKKEIYIVINSPGGSILDGIDLLDYLETQKNVTIICKSCISMAFMIFQLHPSKRLITPSTVLMSHRAKGTISGQFNDGEMESELAFWKSLVNSLEERAANRIQIPLIDYKNKIKDEWWSFGPNIISQGLADEMVTLKCSQALMASKTDKVQGTIFGDVTYKLSDCPLLKMPTDIKVK